MDKNYLMFSYDYPPSEGGISRLCVAIVDELIKLNLEVKALTTVKNTKQGFTPPDIPEIRVPYKRGIRELVSWRKLLKVPKKTVVIVDVWFPEALIAMLAGHRNIVVLAHGNDVMKGKETIKNSLLNIARKYVLEHVSLVICNSQYTQKIVLDTAPKANTIAIPLGVDELRFFPEKTPLRVRKNFKLPIEKKIILTVSRLNAYKAHDVVLKAIASLPANIREQIHYVVAGRGEHLQALIDLSKQLNIYDCVTWLGFVGEQQLTELYQAADLFVLCTREEKEAKAVEGFGLVFLEAQATGIPVIGSNQGGIPDAIDHTNGGFIISRDNITGLAEYFVKLVEQPEIFEKQGQLARDRVVKNCTWQHYGQQVLSAVKKLS